MTEQLDAGLIASQISEDDVRHGLEGNLCRCTGYQNIVKSVLSAAAVMRGEAAIPGSFQDAPTESTSTADATPQPAGASA